MNADERQYQITQVELARFEQQLAAVDSEDPNLHPRLISGRLIVLLKLLIRPKQELADYERHNGSKTD